MPDAIETVRQHVLQEAAQEFLRRKRLQLHPVAVAPVAVTKGDLAVGTADQPLIANRRPMRVAAQVVHQLARTRKRRLRIHHPRPLAAPPQPVAAMRLVAQTGQLRREIQPACDQQVRQAVQVLAPKHLAQPMHRKQEPAAPGDPPRPVRRQRARRHQAVQMKVASQPLVPRVQYERETHLAPEVLAAKRQQGFGRRVEQQIQQGPLVPLAVQNQPVQVVRQGEHLVEVRHRQQLAEAGVHPSGRGHALALRAVAVATAVIRQSLVPAGRTPLAMAAQRLGAAMLDVPHRLPLGPRQTMRLPVRLAVLPKDVRQFAAGRRRRRRCVGRQGSEGGVHSSTSPSPGRRNRSSGLRIDSRCWLVTCKYLAVVVKLVCPISRWITGNATPASIKWVANECRLCRARHKRHYAACRIMPTRH